MARISELPSPEAIKSFKGTLDFYVWRGLPCVRSWPRPPSGPRSPAVQAAAATFSEIIKAQGNWNAVFHDAAIAQTFGTAWTWRDELVAGLYGGLAEPVPEPPPEEQMPYMQMRLLASSGGVWTPLENPGTSYKSANIVAFNMDFDFFPATRYRISGVMWPNASGPTITLQLSEYSSPATPLSAAGDDLVLTLPIIFQDSGWIDFATPPTGSLYLGIAFKGSNTTIDWLAQTLSIEFAYNPS